MYENFKNAVGSGVIWMTEINFSDENSSLYQVFKHLFQWPRKMKVLGTIMEE